MKRIASLAVALLAVLVLVGSASAARSSITLDQVQPVAAGSQVTFTVTGRKAAFVFNLCRTSFGGATNETETLPVVDGSAGPFTVPTNALGCRATLLDEDGDPIMRAGASVGVSYCVQENDPSYACLVD